MMTTHRLVDDDHLLVDDYPMMSSMLVANMRKPLMANSHFSGLCFTKRRELLLAIRWSSLYVLVCFTLSPTVQGTPLVRFK